jgi:acetyl-CoA carboxylase carboxyl transferase subunit alpha
MTKEFLDFEKDLSTIYKDIHVLTKAKKFDNESIDKINLLQKKFKERQTKMYKNLSSWQTLQVARHPDRPHGVDFVENIFTDIDELHGDRQYKDCSAIVGGIARLNDQPIMYFAQEKGRELNDKLSRNWGMMNPEGFRKAHRLMHMAEKFKLPIISFIDTPGAYPGIEAESNNQSAAIAENLFKMSALNVPIIVIITGEGCSGGALGMGIGDKVLILQYATFSVISPEGCASILWRDAAKAPIASEEMWMTAPKLKELKVIDEVIKEPTGGAHDNWEKTFSITKSSIVKHLKQLTSLPIQKVLDDRYKKLMLD